MFLLIESKTGKQVEVKSSDEVASLLKTGGYRYPTAREQEQIARQKRREGLLLESRER